MATGIEFELLNVAFQWGFPAFLTLYLLIRFERVVQGLTTAIYQQTKTLILLQEKVEKEMEFFREELKDIKSLLKR